MDESDQFSQKQALHHMLRCPLSGARLRPATAEECGRALERAGADAKWDEGLVDEAGACFYPVEEGIALVVADRAIVL